MANTLTLKGGAPYNIVKEGGRWYFVGTFFGKEYQNLPKELRLVPEAMIPSTANSDGKTAYIPESQIVGHFQSDAFSQAWKKYRDTYASVGAGTQTRGRTGYPASIPEDPSSVSSVVAAVAKQYDEQSRGTKYDATSGKVDIKTGKTVAASTLPAGWFGTAGQAGDTTGTNAWAIANSKAPNGDYRYVATGGSVFDPNVKREFFFIPDNTGKIAAVGADKYENDLSTLTISQRKAWQRALGSKSIDGILKKNEVDDIIGIARLASYSNFTNIRSGEKGFKVIDPIKYAAEYAKQVRAASGVGRTTTDTTTQAETFTSAFVGDVARQFFNEYLGMEPSQDQINKLTELMNQRAKAKPTTVTTKSTKLDEFGSSRTVRSETPGFGQMEAAELIRQRAKSQTGVTGYQAATKYMDVIMDMVRNPVG